MKTATSKINVDFNVYSTLIFNVSEPWKNLDLAWFSTLISTLCNLRLGRWFSTLIFNVLSTFASNVDFQCWFSTSCKPSPRTLIFNVLPTFASNVDFQCWFSTSCKPSPRTLIFNVLTTFASYVDFQRWFSILNFNVLPTFALNVDFQCWISTFPKSFFFNFPVEILTFLLL